MTLIVLTFLFAIAMSAPGPAGLSPNTLYEWGLRAERPPPCRPLSPAELWAEGESPQGKAATFSLAGEFHCEKGIFRYGERDSFVDFAAIHLGDRIREATMRIAAEYPGPRDWAVMVEAPDQELGEYIRTAFQVDMATAMTRGRILRHGGAHVHADAVVAVRVHMVDEPERLFEVFVVEKDDKGRERWREI